MSQQLKERHRRRKKEILSASNPVRYTIQASLKFLEIVYQSQLNFMLSQHAFLPMLCLTQCCDLKNVLSCNN